MNMNRLAVRVLFFSTLLCISGTLSELIAQQADEVELTNASGTVEVFLVDSAGYVPAQEGMNLGAKDCIKTGSNSSAELSFNQENTNLVRLGANTATEIILADEEKLAMTEGEIFASINNLPSGSAFEIRTPTAVSGARGTDWVTKINSDGTDVEAIDSQPYVRHLETDGTVSKQITPISPGQMTTVAKFQRPLAPRPMPQERRQQWQALKQDVRRRGSEAMQKRQERPVFNRQEFIQQNRVQKVLDSQNNSKAKKLSENNPQMNVDRKVGSPYGVDDVRKGKPVSDNEFGLASPSRGNFPQSRNIGQPPEQDNGATLQIQNRSNRASGQDQDLRAVNKTVGGQDRVLGKGYTLEGPTQGLSRVQGKGSNTVSAVKTPSGGSGVGLSKKPGAAAGRSPSRAPAGGQRAGTT